MVPAILETIAGVTFAVILLFWFFKKPKGSG